MAMVLPDTGDRELRRSGIGGSDCAAICGLNPYRAPLDVYLEKMGFTEGFDSEAAEWGNLLEPVLLRQYAKRNRVWVLGRRDNGRAAEWGPKGGQIPATTAGLNRYLDTLRDPDRPWRMCHIDGLVLDREGGQPVKIIEGKTSSVFRSREWGDGGDEVPEEYVVQCVHNAGVFRAMFHVELPVDMPVLIGGQKFRIYTVEYRESLDRMLIEREEAFWLNHVQKESPPDATPDERGSRGLGVLYPRDSGDELVVDADSPACLLMAALKEAKESYQLHEQRKIAAENSVKEFMQEATKLIGPNFEVAWKKAADSRETDYEAVCKSLKDMVPTDVYSGVVEEHTATKPGSRRFGPPKFREEQQ